jgi:hypothetical protein
MSGTICLNDYSWCHTDSFHTAAISPEGWPLVFGSGNSAAGQFYSIQMMGITSHH